MFFVRYADDFKIFCRNPKSAFKILEATKKWLKERLGLEISKEKSKVVNLRKNYSNFLGIKMKVVPKRKKFVVKSRMSDKAFKNAENNIISKATKIKEKTNYVNVARYNSVILGIQTYYKMATHITKDVSVLAYRTKRRRHNLLKNAYGKKGKIDDTLRRLYGDYLHWRIRFIKGMALFPIDGVKHKSPMNFTQEKCNYTEEGRNLIHKELNGISLDIVHYLMKNPINRESVEFNDNRISRYIGQKGKCFITKKELEIGNMELHHYKAKKDGGSDNYKNLRFLLKPVHKLVHAVDEKIIQKYLIELKLTPEEIFKVNQFRKRVGNLEIKL